jgi:plasmid maintenance system antidote protein VapI
MALRLARVLGATPEFWLNLQMSYELKKALDGSRSIELKRLKPLLMAQN